jgi:AcrR family transcriptional regulator
MILAKSAQLFSKQGYFGASLADIMRETGLEKGGIYNHFASKEDLALKSFDYALEAVTARFILALEGKTNAVDRLMAIVTVFRSFTYDPPFEGGCIVMNTAIEADDTNPALRKKARAAMNGWFEMIERFTRKGIERGEIREDIDPQALATTLISSLEGAVMLGKLYRNPVYMHHAVDHLTWYISNQVSKETEHIEAKPKKKDKKKGKDSKNEQSSSIQ